MNATHINNILDTLTRIRAELEFAKTKAKTDSEVANIETAISSLIDASNSVEVL